MMTLSVEDQGTAAGKWIDKTRSNLIGRMLHLGVEPNLVAVKVATHQSYMA